jgi:hypothetical protein
LLLVVVVVDLVLHHHQPLVEAVEVERVDYCLPQLLWQTALSLSQSELEVRQELMVATLLSLAM